MSNAVFLRPDENGNWGKVGADASGNMSEQLVFQSGATALGNGTAIDVSGYSTLTIDVVISGTATVNFEASVDNVTYTIAACLFLAGGSASVSSTNATLRSIRFNVAGVKWFRTRISSYGSGTVDVYGYASTASVIPMLPVQAYGNADTTAAGTGVPLNATMNLLFDGTNWVRQRSVNAYADGNQITAGVPTGLWAYNGTSWDRVRSVNTGQIVTTIKSSLGNEAAIAAFGDTTAASTGMLGSGAFAMAFNGTTWDRQRVGKVYKYIEYLNLANATATTVWTPASTKKFRLMGVSISVSGTNAAVHLRDGAGGTIFHTVRAPGTDTKTFDFGNGYLSSAVNNVLEIYNLTGGTINVQVTAWGTEE